MKADNRAQRTLVALVGDDDRPRGEFEVGESVGLVAAGLAPARTHDIVVSVNRRRAFTLRLLSDREGAIAPTVLWAQLGLDDPQTGSALTLPGAVRKWAGARLSVAVRRGDEEIAVLIAQVARQQTRPLAVVTDRDGRLTNGIGPADKRRRATSQTHRAYLTLSNVPTEGRVRIHLVRTQRDWRVGDPVAVATLADGRPAVLDAAVRGRGPHTIPLPPLGSLAPGAYDIIVRPLRYGVEDNDARVLLARDAVSARRTTGFVVRESFWTAKPVLGGCVNKVDMAGSSVSGAPYFRYRNAFARGEDVWMALDPGIVDPGNVSKMCAIYVVAEKTTAQWNVDNSLTHLATLGGNAAVQQLMLQAGCVNANKRLVWANAQDLGAYDIVADFGNNVANAAQFAPDAAYDTPLDMIDGYFTAGFRIVEDPGTLAEWANAGSWQYDEFSMPSGFSSPITVQDEQGPYATPGGFTTVNTSVPMRAHVFFPADAAGVTTPAQISAVQASYPLVVIVHGNGHAYTSYDFVLRHLARNGFIAASIHLNSGMRGLGRANVLFQHLALLKSVFGATVQNHIGLMGHSRGGEAIIKAARLNQQGGIGHSIEALLPLAPTDQYGTEVLAAPWATPLFVLYGSRDGDVAGWPPAWGTPGYTVLQTGFSLYDRAQGQTKHMVFVHGASHNGFITTNSDAIDPAIAVSTQQAITQSYVNAFFRMSLRGEAQWDGIFTGEWQPPSVAATGVKLYVQNRAPGQRVIDDFSAGPWTTSTIGGANAVTQVGLVAAPTKGKLCDYSVASPGLDPLSPHDDRGLLLRWAAAGARIEWSIPVGQRDASGFAAVSVRATQKAESPSNPANLAQNLRIAIKDGAGNERAVRTSAFAELPFPDSRPSVAGFDLTKSALTTLRIPLRAYNIVCAGQPKIDLTNVVSVALVFSETATGELEFDDLEFTQ